MSNYNQQNKFIKIDGEYVKLYVTTNQTLPKLLKNTGSLIVYHKETDDNYLYLGNELIAGGWGFSSQNNKEFAEQKLDEWDNFYNFTTGKSFWESLKDNSSNPLSIYYKDALNALDGNNSISIPEIIGKLINNTNDKIGNYILKLSNLSNQKITPYLLQKPLNSEEVGQNIWLDMLPYMLVPASYEKPEIKSKDIKVYYGYYDFQNKNFIHDNNEEILFEAKYVDGQFEVPKGSFIRKVSLNYVIDVKDAGNAYRVSMKNGTTGYRDLDKSGNELNFDFQNLISTLESNDIKRKFEMTSSDNNNFTISISSNSDENNIQIVSVDFIYPFGKSSQLKYALVFDDFILCHDITIQYNKTPSTKFKTYPRLEKANKNGILQNRSSLISYELVLDQGEIETGDEISIKAIDVVMTNLSSNVDQTNYSAIDISINKIFQKYTNFSMIENNHIEMVENISQNQEQESSYYYVCVGVPVSKKIKSIYARIFEDDEYKDIDISGLVVGFNQISFYNTKSPMNYPNMTIKESPDETDMFSQPYSLYFGVFSQQTIFYGYDKKNKLVSIIIDFDDDNENIGKEEYCKNNTSFKSILISDNYLKYYNKTIDYTKYWSNHIYNYAYGKEDVDNINTSMNVSGHGLFLRQFKNGDKEKIDNLRKQVISTLNNLR